MVSTLTPSCTPGFKAPYFELLGTDGKLHTLESVRGTNGLLVMFICNHCPYVKAILDHLIRDCRELGTFGIGTVAIMSNDSREHPEDSWETMKKIAKDLAFPFPYLVDHSQQVAKAYGAVCTPDFFGFNADMVLQYRGRLDSTGKADAQPDSQRELFNAMVQIAETGEGPALQLPSIGCSIKWRNISLKDSIR